MVIYIDFLCGHKKLQAIILNAFTTFVQGVKWPHELCLKQLAEEEENSKPKLLYMQLDYYKTINNYKTPAKVYKYIPKTDSNSLKFVM